MRIASKPAENVSFAESMGRTLVREEPPPTASPARSDDAMLVGAACHGDRAAFGRLYDRYARMVHGVLLARVPRADVDDLSQDVFLLALRRLPTLREPASFGAWLATIARNLATDFHRRLVPHDQWTTETADSVVDKNSEKNSEKDHDGQAIEILETIKRLPDAYRETLILRLVEGMTGPEIAARTGMTPGSVRVNLHRGMQQLRAKLNLNTGSRATEEETS